MAALKDRYLLQFTYWFDFSEPIRIGMILVASAPPGIAVLPFTSLLAGNSILSLFATFGAYISSILIMPGLIFLLTGTETFPMPKLVITLVELIILPTILSRFLLFKNFYRTIIAWKGAIISAVYALLYDFTGR